MAERARLLREIGDVTTVAVRVAGLTDDIAEHVRCAATGFAAREEPQKENNG